MKNTTKNSQPVIINQYFNCCCQKDQEIIKEPKKMPVPKPDPIVTGDCYVFSKNNSLSPGGSSGIALNTQPYHSKKKKQLIYAEPVYNTCTGKVTILAILASFHMVKGSESVSLYLDRRSKIDELNILSANFSKGKGANSHTLSIILSWNQGQGDYMIKESIPAFAVGDKLSVKLKFDQAAPAFPKLCSNNIV